jgi:uncharacterized protein YodC (DUF2158 family)
MSERIIKRGDIVTLNGGGRWMTVEDVEETSITCVWQDEDGELWRETFERDMLTHQDDYDAAEGDDG